MTKHQILLDSGYSSSTNRSTAQASKKGASSGPRAPSNGSPSMPRRLNLHLNKRRFRSTYLDVKPEPPIDLDDDMPLVANIPFNLGNSRLQQLVQDDVAFFHRGASVLPSRWLQVVSWFAEIVSTWSGACPTFAGIRSQARCTTFMCPWRVGSSGRSPNRTDRRWVYTPMPSIIVPRTSMTARTPSALINSSIQAVAQLHKHGIIHGDLHPGNVLFCTPGIDSWTISDFRHQPSRRSSKIESRGTS
jgi:hypothetical protein